MHDFRSVKIDLQSSYNTLFFVLFVILSYYINLLNNFVLRLTVPYYISFLLVVIASNLLTKLLLSLSKTIAFINIA